MGRRVNLSKQNKNIEDILEWYQITKNSLDENEKLIISNKNTTLKQFIGLTKQEVEEYFKYVKDELEKMVCLDLLAAIEAALKIDYFIRAEGKKRETISKFFREDYKKTKGKVSLDGTILSAWKEFYPEYRHKIGAYRGFLKYRNWLAHGRIWEETVLCDVDVVYQICDDIISNLPLET
ncbi:MAG TPA: hypothetical protein PKA28_12460 [Methylomusa anaerophila]|uniref:RiboL-PSP-HEPN domain-containing protein n=1 Tax=Methylomusa anaerophila TaxID=1930071 RepID=A0A348AF64_9FIRM|nr:hypothetical protein [Methylomusa anaerophila]BBB89712.1 hypothetical protein MAMMFC1_00345 [Methylomusa anaerophila]HML89243.1 hypothetical protein [Methylomusa anaerophila]